jgi:hypothetical protein
MLSWQLRSGGLSGWHRPVTQGLPWWNDRRKDRLTGPTWARAVRRLPAQRGAAYTPGPALRRWAGAQQRSGSVDVHLLDWSPTACASRWSQVATFSATSATCPWDHPKPTFDVAVVTVGDPPAGQAARVLLAMLDPTAAPGPPVRPTLSRTCGPPVGPCRGLSGRWPRSPGASSGVTGRDRQPGIGKAFTCGCRARPMASSADLPQRRQVIDIDRDPEVGRRFQVITVDNRGLGRTGRT